MGEPIIVVKGGSLTIEVDLDEECGAPQVSPSGPSQTYTIHWADATLDDGEWKTKSKGKKEMEVKWEKSKPQ